MRRLFPMILGGLLLAGAIVPEMATAATANAPTMSQTVQRPGQVRRSMRRAARQNRRFGRQQRRYSRHHGFSRRRHGGKPLNNRQGVIRGQRGSAAFGRRGAVITTPQNRAGIRRGGTRTQQGQVRTLQPNKKSGR